MSMVKKNEEFLRLVTYDYGRCLHATILLAEIKERSGAKGTDSIQKDIEGKRLCGVACDHTC